MISERELYRHCHERTMQRARSIASSDKNILTKQVRYDSNATVLSAFVASSHGWDDRYRTSVAFDEESDLVLDYSCTCPAYREYDGMCKHCAALALSYNAAPDKFIGHQAVRATTTSSRLLELMHRTEQLADEDELQGSINIEPTLVYGYRTWSAHFKIVGPQGSYVMKSISDFVERMRTGEHFSYGKKLAFTHVPTLLTDQGRALAQFLDRALALRERTSGLPFWSYRSRDEVGRTLQLTDAETIELLDLLSDRTFTVQGTDIGTRSVTHARVVDENPRISLKLRPDEYGGYALTCPDDLVLTSQGDRLYIWQDDVFYRCSPAFSTCGDFLRTMYDSDEDVLTIAEADMPLFCATALPTIEKHLNVQMPQEIEAYRPIPCKVEYFFDKDDAFVTCDAWAVYGQRRFLLCGFETEETSDAESPAPMRNERLEKKALALAGRYFNHADATINLADDERVAALLFGGLAEFRALGDVFTTPAFDRLIRDKKPRVTLGVSLAGNLINLTVSAEDLPTRELSALLASYRKRKRYHRLRNGVFLDLEDFDLSQLDRLASDLGLTAKQLTAGHAELPAYRAFYLDEEADLERDRSFTHYVEGFRHVDESAYELPGSLVDTVRPYQEEGFHWLSARCDAGFGGILADEMGLGKSLQLISLLLARRDEARAAGPSLIVCPASLVYNWLAEFERFAPELKVRAVVGTKRERANVRTAAFEDDDRCDVLVTSYDLVRIDASDYAGREFFCCALDEAQYIKNPAALTTRAVKRIDAQHRFALTGTPMENRLSELWSIFDFLMPGLLGPYTRFRERFEGPVVGGDEFVARRLQAVVGPFMLRRLKTDVLRDLPDKLESIVYASLEGEQRRLYDAHEQRLREELTAQRKNKNKQDFDKRKVEVLAELTKLRQLCCDPRLLYENYAGSAAKLDTLVELVESAMDGGEKTLVFSQFTSFLSRISEQLDARDIPYYTITGATPKKKRLELVDAFNADDTPVFLVSLKAGGTGLNLTGASVVIHADPWWNAAAQNQATDRAHRIGQTRVVSVQRVIAKDTIEERIVRLQEAKSELADQVVGASGVSLASLSQEDLIDLLQG